MKVPPLFLIIVLSLFSITSSPAQQPSKEYIRLGGRVIAVENPSVVVTVTPSSPPSIGSSDTATFTAAVQPTQGNPQFQWNASAGTVSPAGIFTPPSGVTSSQTVNITATLMPSGPVSNSVAITVIPALQPQSSSFTSTGSQDNLVTVTKSGSWTATSNVGGANPWLTVGQIVNNQVHYSVASNPDPNARTGTLTIAGNTFTVTQGGSGQNPTIVLSTNSVNVSGVLTSQQTFSVGVTAGGGATWQVTQVPSWVTLLSPSLNQPQPTSGTVTFSAASNPGTGTRSLPIIIEGQTVTVNQYGGVTFNPTSQQVPAVPNQTYTVNVTTPAGTTWIASSSPWIEIQSGGQFTSPSGGSQQISYLVQSNINGDQRLGSISIGPITFTVTQLADTTQPFTISPSTTALNQSQVQTFNAKLFGNPINPGSVAWAVTAGLGQTTSPGVYQAPSSISSASTATVTATYQTYSASATIWLLWNPFSQGLNINPSFNSAPYFPYQNFILTLPAPQGGGSWVNYSPLEILFTRNPASGGALPSGGNSCYLQWNLVNPQISQLSLINDQASGPAGTATVFSNFTNSGTLTNTQCSLDLAGFSISLQGINIVLGLKVMFLAPFAGNNTSVYVRSFTSPSGNIYFNPQVLGSYTIPGYLPPNIGLVIPAANTTVSNSVTLQGWALDNQQRVETPISAIEVFVDNVKLPGNATYNLAPPAGSPVVCSTTLPSPGCPNIGFSYVWNTVGLTNGTHTVRVQATDSDPTTPHSSYTDTTFTVSNPVSVAVSPPTATLSVNQTVTLTATVTGPSNTAVTWSMTPSVGTLSAGVYTAPPTIANPQTVTVTATSVADPTKSNFATITLTPVSVSLSPVTPPSVQLSAGQTQAFTATATGTSNQGFTWTLTPSGLGSLTAQTTSTGSNTYTAPSTITSQQTVTLRATSVVDASQFKEATITLSPPPPVTIAFVTSPTGLAITADGSPYTAPLQWIPGSSHTIAVSSPQAGATGTQYVFASWSDSGAQSHSITTPGSATTYTATFTTQYQLTTAASPTVGGSISPATGNWYNSGTVVSVSASPNSGYTFSGFSGDLTGTTTPQNLSMTAARSVTANFSASGGGNGYSYHRTITINHTLVPSSLVNFPLEFKTTDPLLKTIGNSGHVNNNNGWDIIFSLDPSGTPKLDHEIESYDGGNGTFIAWVRIPALSSTTDAVIHLFYGNPGINASQENKPGVWDTNYKGVWHLRDGTTLTANDSTSGGNTGAIQGTTAAIAGQIDGGASFTNSGTQKILVSNSASLNNITSITVSAWIKPTTFGGGSKGRIFDKALSGGWNLLLLDTAPGTKTMQFGDSWSGNSNANWTAANNSLATSAFQYVDVTYNGSSTSNNPVFYVNGNVVGTVVQSAPTGTLSNDSNDLNIGSRSSDTARIFDGIIDEARVSNIIRSADWIKTEYNNQSNPNAFYGLSGESGGVSTVAVTLVTSPTGLAITADGSPYTAPLQWIPGSSHTIAVSSPQAGATGTQYVFASWSDSGAQSHSITTPGSATTYTATFTTQYQLTTAASPTVGGSISPATGNWYNSGTVVSVSASPNSGYTFSGFSGDLTGTTTPQNLSMTAARSVTATFTSTSITVQTSPAGRTITVDSTNYTAPQTFQWAPGSTHTIAVSSPQAGATGTQYVFASWSDSGAQSHSITTPGSATTYTATFTTQYQLTTAASPTVGGSISPATGNWYNSGTVVSVSASPNSGYTFSGFSGDLTGTTTPQNLSMTAARSVTANFSTSGGGNGYSYHRTITINHNLVPNTDQTNFPFVFNTTDALLKTTGNGGHVSNSNGYDIIFTSDAAGSVKLDHEIESYSASTGQFTAWVRIQTLSHTTDTVIHLFYGNSIVTTSQENKTAVWDSNFKTVWHMNNSAASGTVTDSTSNNNAGTAAANTNGKTTTGKIGNALTFNGSSDFVWAGNSSAGTSLHPYSQELWFKTTVANGHVIANWEDSHTAGGSINSAYFLMMWIGTDGKAHVGGQYQNEVATAAGTQNDGAWHQLVLTTDASTVKGYLDGSLLGSTADAAGDTTTFYFRVAGDAGFYWTNSADGFFNGQVDEVRTSNIVRSADWIKTEFNNQNSPGTFYGLSGEL